MSKSFQLPLELYKQSVSNSVRKQEELDMDCTCPACRLDSRTLELVLCSMAILEPEQYWFEGCHKSLLTFREIHASLFD